MVVNRVSTAALGAALALRDPGLGRYQLIRS